MLSLLMAIIGTTLLLTQAIVEGTANVGDRLQMPSESCKLCFKYMVAAISRFRLGLSTRCRVIGVDSTV